MKFCTPNANRIALLTFSALTTVAGAADFSDTTLAYRYGAHFTEPARANDISKNIYTLTHLSQGSTGIHFVSLEGRFSDAEDPAKNSGSGATEYLLNYRYQLPAKQITGEALSFGPVRETALTLGADLTEKNTLFAPRKRAWVAGPTLKFDVPGYLDLGLLYYQESNHKGLPNTPHPNIDFSGTWMLSANWAIPFELGSTRTVFQGLWNRLGEKGNDFNDRPTASETLLRTALMFDIGRWSQLPTNTLLAGIGYEWWINKYGNPAGTGTETRTTTLNLEYHY